MVIYTTGVSLAVGGLSGNLNGTVVDNQTGAPLANVAVTAASPSGTYHATTDSHGFFNMLQLPVDTYTVSFEKTGYVRLPVAGVVVFGDEQNTVGTVRLQKGLKTIAQVRSSAGSAYKPDQTLDETTFVGQRVDQALGQSGSTNYNQLALSAPGVMQTDTGTLSIRGSLQTEIGYQFDGVNMEGSFFDENGNLGFLNGVGGGFGGVQVVSGAGDATQGNVGAGIINVIPGQGTYPAKGFVSMGVGSPYYNHNFALEYGAATPNHRFSDFISVRSARYAPQYAPYGVESSFACASPYGQANCGQYFGTGYTAHDDVMNNFFYKWGKNDKESLQVLTQWINLTQWGNYGGLQNVNWYPWDPFSYAGNIAPFGFPLIPSYSTNPMDPSLSNCGGAANPNCNPQLSYYDSLLTYLPGVPKSFTPVTQPEINNYQPVSFVKIGYTNQFNPTTTFNTFFYNWGGLEAGAGTNYTLGAGDPAYFQLGGRRVGFQAQLTKQMGEKHTLTLVGKFENSFPRWDQQGAGTYFFNFALQQFLYAGALNSQSAGGDNTPAIWDWFLPANPGQPVSASNPCLGPTIGNGWAPNAPATDVNGNPEGCYIYSYLLANGKWTGQLPKIPTMGIGYHNSDFQTYGIGIRDQWQPSENLHVDLGVREDGQNIRFGPNPFAKDPYGNPSDVPPSFIGPDFSKPRFFEPRVSVDYNVTNRDAIRASYARSVIFFFAQNGGTPASADLRYWNPLYLQMPAKDSASNPACGSGWHGPGAGYSQNPNNYTSNPTPGGGWFFQCGSYAQSLFWLWDQMDDAPDLGGQGPPTYNNWDLEYQHLFHNGWGARITGYARRGFNVEQNTLLLNGPPNPVTGQSSASVFATKNTGVEKTTGVEFMLTTPDRGVGWSGFLTANYINELTNTPPVAGSESLPILPQQLLLTNKLFHANFLPPISARAGIEYRTAHWKFNPIVSFFSGYPFGVGKDAIGYVNGTLYDLPETNFGVATPYAGPNGPNNAYNASYFVDPSNPGNYFSPNIYASRGYNEPALAGQQFTRPRLYTDFDIEYNVGNLTFGTYVSNVFNNYRSEPQINTAFQPVVTGVGGPQTGLYAGAYPNGTINPFYGVGARDEALLNQRWSPYMEYYTPGRTFTFYTQYNIK
jgi:hypothetical protein